MVLGCVRARLQSCRTVRYKGLGFSSCKRSSGTEAVKKDFFGPAESGP